VGESTKHKRERILVVDDEVFIADLLSRWFTREGYQCAAASGGIEALELLDREEFHLVVSDITMPGMSGIDLLKTMKSRFPDTAVLMATAISDRETAILALKLGAYGYSIKPFDRNEMLINVANALERRRVILRMRDYERDLEEKVRERTAQVRQREEQIILRLLSAAEYRDDETGAHIKRIGLYSASMARELGWAATAVGDIRLAAPMHDVGKIGIPDRILQKPGKLTSEEFEIMKKHTEIGARILDCPEVPLLQLAKEVALSHHERWDGMGYPGGLSGLSIPESGRIVAVADVYDALSHRRVYREALPGYVAVSMVNEEKGTHFDPRVVECFMDVISEIVQISEQVRETKGRV
jgi:putative two-component system response regulator